MGSLSGNDLRHGKALIAGVQAAREALRRQPECAEALDLVERLHEDLADWTLENVPDLIAELGCLCGEIENASPKREQNSRRDIDKRFLISEIDELRRARDGWRERAGRAEAELEEAYERIEQLEDVDPPKDW